MPKFTFDPTKIMSVLPDDKPPARAPKIFLLGLLIVVLLAGGAAAYFFYLEPRLTPPEVVLSKMVEAEKVVNAVRGSGRFHLALSREPVAGEESASDAARSAEAAESMVVNVEVGSDSLYVPTAETAQSWSVSAYGLPSDSLWPSRFNLKFDTRLLDQALYLRLREAPTLGFFDLEPWRGEWIKVANLVWPQGLFSRSSLLRTTDILPTEKLEGADTYHYRFVLERPAFKALVLDFINLLTASAPGAADTLALEQMIENITLPEGEIWIGRRDHLLRRFTLGGKIDKLAPSSNRRYNGEYTLDWSLANYNYSPQITRPTTFVNLEQILAESSATTTPETP